MPSLVPSNMSSGERGELNDLSSVVIENFDTWRCVWKAHVFLNIDLLHLNPFRKYNKQITTTRLEINCLVWDCPSQFCPRLPNADPAFCADTDPPRLLPLPSDDGG